MSAIGFLDSGVGGLSVLLAVRDRLPDHPLLYYADTAAFPYGPRPPVEIQARVHHVCNRLVERGAGAIVLACNTATTAAVASARRCVSVPIVGMEPAIKPACAATRTGRIAVLATEGTVRGEAVQDLVGRFGAGVEVLTLAAPGLADRVEDGDLDGDETRDLLDGYLAPVRRAGADVLVLGCTHYVFLRPLIAAILGPDVTIVDTGEAVARQVARVLSDLREPPRVRPRSGHIQYVASGPPAGLAQTLDRLRAAGIDLPAGPVLADEERS